MAGERVSSLLLEAGDLIHVCHHHDLQCGECLSNWDMDVVVIEDPAPVEDRIAVKWAQPFGASHAITGVSLFYPDEPVLRLGRLPLLP
jgi:hypothetical protein